MNYGNHITASIDSQMAKHTVSFLPQCLGCLIFTPLHPKLTKTVWFPWLERDINSIKHLGNVSGGRQTHGTFVGRRNTRFRGYVRPATKKIGRRFIPRFRKQ